MNRLESIETMADRLAVVLRDAIVSGSLRPQDTLKEDQLAVEYGVSRVPIREALRKLAGQGFIDIAPYHGASVRPLSVDELEDLVELRIAVEGLSLRHAIPAMSQADIECAEIYAAKKRNTADTVALLEATWQFLETVHLPAKRPYLLETIHTAFLKSSRYYHFFVPIRSELDRSAPFETDLLEMCRRRDIDGATRLLHTRYRAVTSVIADNLSKARQKLAVDPIA